MFLRQGLASSTQKTYVSAQRSFLQFCELENRLNSNRSPFPSNEWTLCLFATWLASSLKPASIKVYLSAVRALHIKHGYSDPLVGCLRLQHVVKGIKRCKGSSANKRLPITPDIFTAIYRCLDYSVYDDVLFWAACCLAYFGFLRSSEFTVPHGDAYTPALHLSHEDVAFDRRVNPSSIQVTIKVSKTDPFRQGCTLTLGQGRPPLCPVESLLNYLDIRGCSAGPLFVRSNGIPLTRAVLTECLRQLLAQAGIAGHFGSHSFRIGAATTAGLAGVPDHMIQTLGRWNSSAYLAYIRTPQTLLANISTMLR